MEMDLDDFRMILSRSRVDVWTFIDTAIKVASLEYSDELKDRRDGIVERLYASCTPLCRNCGADADADADADVDRRRPTGVANAKTSMERDYSPETKRAGSPLTPQSNHRDDEEDEEPDPYGGLFDDEQTKILRIKEQIEDPEQSEEYLVEVLQGLADMDITFKALKETDIGRHVNQLRKHPSNDVRRLVKQLVRKWKDLVDEWVRLNRPELAPSTLIATAAAADGDSPQQTIPKNAQNGHHQVPDFAYSPNPHNGSSGSERNNSEPEQKIKAVPRRELPVKPPQSLPVSASVPPPNRASYKGTNIDAERLNSARRRLQENYQEAENAKKQRTIQVMDIHEIPKPKNTFFAKNKGGGFQGRQHR